MKTKSSIALIILSIVASLPFSSQALAESGNLQQMANIVIHLNHHPNTQDKQLLKNIIEQGSAAERGIAKALLNMNHKIDQADKTVLMQISNNNQQPDNTRELARIVSRVNHKASAADKQKLHKM